MCTAGRPPLGAAASLPCSHSLCPRCDLRGGSAATPWNAPGRASPALQPLLPVSPHSAHGGHS